MHIFPYTNYHDINLDWIIEYLNSAKIELESLVSQFENLIVQTTGTSTEHVMSQNAVTVQLNYLSTRINTVNTDISNINEHIATIDNNIDSLALRVTALETAVSRFYVIINRTSSSVTMNVSPSELLLYRERTNVCYYINDTVNIFVRWAYNAYSPTSTTTYIQTLPYADENAVYRVTITAEGDLTFNTIRLVSISQTTGASQTSAMSQRATTKAIADAKDVVWLPILTNASGVLYTNKGFNECLALLLANSNYVCFVENADLNRYFYVESFSSTQIDAYSIPTPSGIDMYTYKITYTPEGLTRTVVGTSVSLRIPRIVLQVSGTSVAIAAPVTLYGAINNGYSPQIYVFFEDDNVTEQFYIDSFSTDGYVLRNNNWILTYTHVTQRATIEEVEKVFTSTATGVQRIAEGATTGYNLLTIDDPTIDLSNYYIIDTDITNLSGGSDLVSTSLLSTVNYNDHPKITIYSNGVAFSGSWAITCKHK